MPIQGIQNLIKLLTKFKLQCNIFNKLASIILTYDFFYYINTNTYQKN